MAPEKLRQPPQNPPMFARNPNSIIDDTKLLIERSRKSQDQVAANARPDTATFANVLQPLAQAENAQALEANILRFYQAVSPDPKLRAASIEAQNLLDEFAIETAMREDLYVLVKAVLQKNETLDPESHIFLKRVHKDFIQNGLELPIGSKRNRFKEIKIQLSQLSNEFQKNQTEENGGIWFTREELDGVPEDVVSGLERGERENYGMFRLTFKGPDLYPALRLAKNGDTRRRCHVGNDNKCNENVPIFKEIMALRDEAARLLGYPNHAAFRLEDKMAKTPETVDAFLGDLRSRLAAGGRQEIEELKRIKKADLDSRGERFDGQYFLWDHAFYNGMMLQNNYSFDQQKLAEYFPLETTLSHMLKTFEHLFGLVFIEIIGEERGILVSSGKSIDTVWHEAVQIFTVWNDEAQGSRFLGYLYMDLFSRDDKYENPSNWNLQPGFDQEDGTHRYPATALVCSFTKPTPKKPSLLKHEEVWTLFHELGHGIHDLVAKTKYSRFHGTASPVDFAEAPSQMLEFWCWTPSQLKSLGRHYSSLSSEYLKTWEEQAQGKPKPPDQIPDEMIENLIRTRYVNVALYHLRLLHLGIFDMLVHEPESHEAIEKLNISAKWNTLRKDLTQMDGPEILGYDDEWGHGEANFGHLMGDYDAGFYSYLFSKVFATDMFYSVFKQDPMNAKEGRRYRYQVLEKGASQDEMKTLTEFLGRKPKTGAFYMELGLA